MLGMTDYFFDDRINQTQLKMQQNAFLALKDRVKQQIKDVINY
jgi:hypothetical protein